MNEGKCIILHIINVLYDCLFDEIFFDFHQI